MQKGAPPQQAQPYTPTKTNHPKRTLRKSKWKKAWHQHKPKQPKPWGKACIFKANLGHTQVKAFKTQVNTNKIKWNFDFK